MDIVNIYDNCNSYFNADLKAIFERCSKIAFKNGYKFYLIGGIVRDMLLNNQSLDVDITVEGNAIDFAHILEKKAGAKILSVHKNFSTAKIEIQGQKIDLASTRSESYPKAGHLPVIKNIGCPLEKDILRRDFTINSLAMSLNQDDFAHLIDYVGGLKDLRSKKIRILHNKSFVDDPTRIIRGLKYASRLGFELDSKTLKLQKEYLNNINYDMCYKRVKQEIKKTFNDCSPETFEKFIKQGIYRLITPHPGFAHPLPQGARVIGRLIQKYSPKYSWLVYFGVCTINENLDRFELTKHEKEIISDVKKLTNKSFTSDFEIYKAFCTKKIETLLILALLGREKDVLHYLNNFKKIKLQIKGDDLIKLGFKPSKDFKKIFDLVLKEKLENPKMNKKEEIELAKQYLNK